MSVSWKPLLISAAFLAVCGYAAVRLLSLAPPSSSSTTTRRRPMFRAAGVAGERQPPAATLPYVRPGLAPVPGADADMTDVLPTQSDDLRGALGDLATSAYVYNEPLAPSLSPWNPLSWWSLADGRTPTGYIEGYDYIPWYKRLWSGPWVGHDCDDGRGPCTRRRRRPQRSQQPSPPGVPTRLGATESTFLSETAIVASHADKPLPMPVADLSHLVHPRRVQPRMGSVRRRDDTAPPVPRGADLSHLQHPQRAPLPRSNASLSATPLAGRYGTTTPRAQTMSSDAIQ
jgi:hypothetical protein